MLPILVLRTQTSVKVGKVLKNQLDVFEWKDLWFLWISFMCELPVPHQRNRNFSYFSFFVCDVVQLKELLHPTPKKVLRFLLSEITFSPCWMSAEVFGVIIANVSTMISCLASVFIYSPAQSLFSLFSSIKRAFQFTGGCTAEWVAAFAKTSGLFRAQMPRVPLLTWLSERL